MIIEAVVKINQKKFSVKKGDKWLISVISEPKSNKANIEIIKELSKKYRTVRILRGAKRSKKLLEIV